MFIWHTPSKMCKHPINDVFSYHILFRAIKYTTSSSVFNFLLSFDANFPDNTIDFSRVGLPTPGLVGIAYSTQELAFQTLFLQQRGPSTSAELKGERVKVF